MRKHLRGPANGSERHKIEPLKVRELKELRGTGTLKLAPSAGANPNSGTTFCGCACPQTPTGCTQVP